MRKTNFFGFCVAATVLLGTGAANAATTIDSWTSGSTMLVLTDDSLTVSGMGAMDNYYVSYLNMPWYSSRFAIKTVVINYGVTRIGNYAFYGCSGLTSVTIPNSVTSIGKGAFYECRGLTGALTIPDGVTSIEEDAFYRCSGLTGALTIPDGVTSIGKSAFEGCSGLTGALTIPDGVTSIENSAFYDCRGLTGALTIPNSVTSIGAYAFAYCSGLTGALTIPDGVTSIGREAFSGCSGLTGALTIPDGVIWIGEEAFYACSGLTSVTIPDGVTSIGDRAFTWCVSLTAINVDGANTKYSSVDGVLYNKNQTALVCYPVGKQGAFTIPNSVTSIGAYAFYGCSGRLTSVTIPDGVTSIGKAAFSDCSGLTGALTIPNGVTSIGDMAFYGCRGLTSVTIGNSVTSIGNNAFECRGPLTSVTCLATTPPSLGRDNFVHIVDTLYVPAGSLDAYKNSDWNSVFRTILAIAVPATSVSLNPTSATLSVGGTKQLTASISPADATNTAVTWSSSNPAVATVSASGEVTAVSVGSATITVTTTDGGFTATCDVNVAATGTFVSTSAVNTTYTAGLTLADITLPANYAWETPTTAVNAGNGQTFTAIYTDPSGNYEAATGNVTVNVAKATPSVTYPTQATVQFGATLATAVFTGGSSDVSGAFAFSSASTIPALSNSNTTNYELVFTPTDIVNYNTTTKTDMKVTVVVPSSDAILSSLAVTGYSILPVFDANTTVYTLTVPNGVNSVTIEATATDSKSVTGTGSKFIAVGENPFTITVTAEDGATTKEYLLIITREAENSVTAVATQTIISLQIYPNPARDRITIVSDEWNVGDKVKIYNLAGALVEATHVSPQQGNTITIDVAHLPAGIYIVKVGNKSAKVVKQ
ncbi:hypothetical protein AGMMS4957_02580 [Bacteroidia bacterium]|nr:hypothetical protein AGMMS4957_02580 [Bacteroidia bacterium]